MSFSQLRILFDGKECKLKFEKYSDTDINKLTLWYYDKETKEDIPFKEATVNIEHESMNKKVDFVIKDYSENTGILETLVAFKILQKPYMTLHYQDYPCTKFPVAKANKLRTNTKRKREQTVLFPIK